MSLMDMRSKLAAQLTGDWQNFQYFAKESWKTNSKIEEKTFSNLTTAQFYKMNYWQRQAIEAYVTSGTGSSDYIQKIVNQYSGQPASGDAIESLQELADFYG